jgi:hypothetical protein
MRGESEGSPQDALIPWAGAEERQAMRSNTRFSNDELW